MNALYQEELSAMPRLSSGSRVLVTGASGLIGSFLVDALRRMPGVLVTAMGRDEARLSARFAAHERLALLPQDVADPLPGGLVFDFIIHAASPAHPLAFSKNPVDTMRANLDGTRNLLEHLHEQGHGRLLFVSSGEIYGENTSGEDFREGDTGLLDPAQPRSCYPESKRAAETLCASYLSQYGVDAVIARLCYVFGPGITSENSRADAQFLRNALQGQDIVMKSKGGQLRSYLYVADAARALLTLLIAGASGQAYNVSAPNHQRSIRQYAQALADAAGVALRFELPATVEAAGYSRQTRAALDGAKLAALGFSPSFSPEQGIARMVEIAREA